VGTNENFGYTKGNFHGKSEELFTYYARYIQKSQIMETKFYNPNLIEHENLIKTDRVSKHG